MACNIKEKINNSKKKIFQLEQELARNNYSINNIQEEIIIEKKKLSMYIDELNLFTGHDSST
jgi:2C-methyl-D-erythritol 2,4-cyclodiphosphate synthase